MAACSCDGDNDRQDRRESDALVAMCTALAELFVQIRDLIAAERPRRRIGKSTLVEHLVPDERRRATLDDLDVLDAARRAQEVAVGGPGSVTLDEVRREPELPRTAMRAERAELGYWRTSIGEEVDFVVEGVGQPLPVDVSWAARSRLSDSAHLRTVRAEYGRKARAGLLLRNGRSIDSLAPDVMAAPWWTVR